MQNFTMPTMRPFTLSLITTFKCTSACTNCCFGCSPNIQQNKLMSFDEISRYIDIVCNTFPSISAVIFTGGECTLLGEDLIKSISKAHSLNKITRIVTNGHWAKNSDYLIREWVKAGLSEINFSTGFEHSKFVSTDTLFYAVEKCFEQESLQKIVINVEAFNNQNNVFNIKETIWYKNLNAKFKERLIILSSPWIKFHTSNLCSNDSNNASDKNIVINYDQGCNSILRDIHIDPYGKLLSCCGLSSESTNYLNNGSIISDDLLSAYESGYYDLFKLWIFTDGPYKILKQLGFSDIPTNRHICEYCHFITSNQAIINRLKEEGIGNAKSILLNYHLKLKRLNYL